MPNKSSNAAHKPVRTCVICKSKQDQRSLLNFFILGKEIVFDIKRAVDCRKKYVCYQEECLKKLPLWVSRQHKKTAVAKQKQVS